MPDPQHPKIRFEEDGSLWLNFGEYGKEVELAAFSADGSTLVIVREVGVAQVWSVATGALLREIRPTSPLEGSAAAPTTRPFQVFIEAVALSPDGDRLLLGLNDGTAGVFRVTDGTRLSVLHDPETPPASRWEVVRVATFSDDGALVLVGFSDRAVGVWDGTGERLLRFLKPPPVPSPQGGMVIRGALVSSVSVSREGRYLFAGYSDMTATIWDLHTGERLFEAREHAEEIIALHTAEGAVRWATGDGSVWEAQPGATPRKRLDTGQPWHEAAFHPDGASLLARTSAGVTRWRLDGSSELLAEFPSPMAWPHRAETLGFSSNGERCYFPETPDTLAVLTGGERVRLRTDAKPNLDTRGSNAPPEIIRHLAEIPRPRILQVVLSPDGALLAGCGHHPQVDVWDTATGERVACLQHPENVNAIQFSADGRLLAAAMIHHISLNEPYGLYVWSVADGEVVRRFSGHRHFIYRFGFHPDGTWVASASHDHTVRLWDLTQDVEEPDPRERAERADLDPWHLQVLSDGRLLIFRTTVLEVHHGPDRKVVVVRFPDYWERVWSVSADEWTIAGSDRAQQVSVWSLEDGTLLHTHAAPIPRPEVVPDLREGDFRSRGGAALWQGSGGPYLHQSDGPRGWVTRLTLTPERDLVAIPGENEVAVVRLGPPQEIVTRCPFEGRLRAGLVTDTSVLLVNSTGQVRVLPR